MPRTYQTIQSVERAFLILNALAKGKENGLSLGQVSKTVGVNPSTAHHLLGTLVQNQIVEQDPASKHYRLGIHLIELGNAALTSTSLARIATANIERLWQNIGQSVSLLVFHGLVRTIILNKSSREALSVNPAPLEITTLHATGSGKMLLAFLPEQDLDSFLQHTRLERFTANTITGQEELLEELHRIRENGVSYDREEHGKGVCCIASPIRDSTRRVVGCLDIVFPSFNITGDQIRCWEQLAFESALELSDQLKNIGLVVQ